MDKKITELVRDPFAVVLADRDVGLVIDSRSGNVLIYGAALMAWKGIAFSLTRAATGQVLRLQYRDITIDVGWTEDLVETATWVDEVNRFLETKRDSTVPSGHGVPQPSAGAIVG